MNSIDRDELREKLDAGDDIKLVMALAGYQYRSKRIPGSISITSLPEARRRLAPDDEIVVYCTDATSVASPFLTRTLSGNGFSAVRRYAGGVADWEAAGLPLEGEAVEPQGA